MNDIRIPTFPEKRRNRWHISLDLANYRRILALRNLHRGEQCVVMATGPSIGQTDMSLIENHPFVFGVNAAFRVRNRFCYYLCSCPNFYLVNENRIRAVDAGKFFFSSHIPFERAGDRVYLKLFERKSIHRSGHFHYNLTRALYWGPTVILDLALPAALWMGFSEIVLLGADYTLQNYRHFYSEKEHGTIRQINCEHEMALAHRSFAVVKDYLIRQGSRTRIINCSPLTDLDCFERAELEQVIGR